MLSELMALLADEEQAVIGYRKVMALSDNENVNSALLEIMNDELQHIGKLMALVAEIDNSAGEKITEGIGGE
jgi:rubrerythrin